MRQGLSPILSYSPGPEVLVAHPNKRSMRRLQRHCDLSIVVRYRNDIFNKLHTPLTAIVSTRDLFLLPYRGSLLSASEERFRPHLRCSRSQRVSRVFSFQSLVVSLLFLPVASCLSLPDHICTGLTVTIRNAFLFSRVAQSTWSWLFFCLYSS